MNEPVVSEQIQLILPVDRFKDPRQISSLSFAFVGDCIYELYVRTQIVCQREVSPKKMQMISSAWACAPMQAKICQGLSEVLNEEEMNVVRKAKNTHLHTIPKHASRTEYAYATALESLLGWLYLSDQKQRLQEILCLIQKFGQEMMDEAGTDRT